MRVQFLAVILLATMVVGLPLYWILEPGRQDGQDPQLGQAVRHLGFGAVRAARPTAASTAPAATAG